MQRRKGEHEGEKGISRKQEKKMDGQGENEGQLGQTYDRNIANYERNV